MVGIFIDLMLLSSKTATSQTLMIVSPSNQIAPMLLCRISAALALMESLLVLLDNTSERQILQVS
jgi:hypothetical protein